MSIPIKETPVLSTKETNQFLAKVKQNENKRVSKEEHKKSVELYYKVIKNNPEIR